ncbi:hypothetical protein ERO13_D13G232900v2 [Gossypium hirsutum]|uniref:Methyl-CpG-binding domain-containing protein 5 n=5 Tax=Gossypium TaxID=3633 RepID=A0A1U8M6N2_GOSHI|nr:methyl-CpG-binding domain-containing protein 5-like [Gossypium hirsutum]KAB1996933.1 hypothetical protein ES319_D13G265700v1 [Gossypium barbadense]TYG39119.1 hypothetical protein ES288_D13G278700v1 [Gossypium darwinii]TYH36645.1 hypothetical protein ES332_D13G278300v1 [Gossypium tomentosum]TYI48788.1 hypothetical protein E1A91_D13G271800v1 [Gossypium mustelinum]KAG4113587.1 hypothetical protein ERO13_D13G232900v2 [Gossypium hirsutum]
MSDPVQTSPADLPSDPLLKPGAFIDVNGQGKPAEPTKSRNGLIPNGSQPETPSRGSVNSSSSADSKVKRRVVAPETWLPPGWLIEDRVRTSGATAGLVDKYYVDPTSGRKFRSKKEVLYFLENGSPPPKRKKGTELPGSEVPSTGNSPGQKQKKSAKKQKPLNFDFINVPEKVDWFLTDACSDSWTPFLGNDLVSESTKQDWAAAFTSLTVKKSSQAMF